MKLCWPSKIWKLVARTGPTAPKKGNGPVLMSIADPELCIQKVDFFI